MPDFFFFFNDTATTEIYTLSLHDALPISEGEKAPAGHHHRIQPGAARRRAVCGDGDRKSTRLNSSHVRISYAVFCLKKKNPLRRAGRGSSSRRVRAPGPRPPPCLCPSTLG